MPTKFNEVLKVFRKHWFKRAEAVKATSFEALVLFQPDILLNNPTDDVYFADKIKTNYQQFDKLLPYIKDQYRHWSCYDTTEGVGVLRFKEEVSK